MQTYNTLASDEKSSQAGGMQEASRAMFLAKNSIKGVTPTTVAGRNK